MASSGREDKEEQFIFRVAEPALAEKIRSALREEGTQDLDGFKLVFKDAERQGELIVDGEEPYKVSVLDLPTVVESYKTYDDINLVKTSDVGQMLLVHRQQPEPQGTESEDGLTPAMRNARQRLFSKPCDVEPELVAKVEQDLLTILAGQAPPGVEYQDVEEEYVVDPVTGVGSWQPVARQSNA